MDEAERETDRQTDSNFSISRATVRLRLYTPDDNATRSRKSLSGSEPGIAIAYAYPGGVVVKIRHKAGTPLKELILPFCLRN